MTPNIVTDSQTRLIARYGDPTVNKQWQIDNLTLIKAPGGATFLVNKLDAKYFQSFVNELENSGYKINSRDVSSFSLNNQTNILTYNAFGAAIEINMTQNPYSGPTENVLATDLPKNISTLALKYQLQWGGDWTSVKKPSHFQRNLPNST